MKRYIVSRLWKSIVSIFIVVAIVIVMVYTLIPRSQVFANDISLTKITGNNKTIYMNNVLEDLGYLSFHTQGEMCKYKSENYDECMKEGSQELEKVRQLYEKDGYTVQELTLDDDLKGQFVAIRDYSKFELIFRYMKNLIQFDHKNKIQDPNNPDLERSYSFGGSGGNWGLQCSGCEYKYQLYFNGKFPFIHQNVVKLNFGKSYPTYSGRNTLDVITDDQGKMVNIKQVFPNGKEINSPIKQDTCRYKYTPGPLDKMKFDDNYADCKTMGDAPSMVSTSYIFGITSVILAYLISMPIGIHMARKKGKFADKVGVVYINLLIAVPSLAFIFFMRYLGSKVGLPDLFPQLGFGNIKSYIMPVLILALLSTPGIMMWLRRYMLDQASADYVKFAKAKGLSQREIFNKHILKNAIIPIVNGIPASIILAISGAVITETVFAIPGMGKMLPDAINASNNNIVITLTFIFTTLSIFAVMIGDILMTMVDPRIKLDTKKED
ncbi:MAG: ABC transporter permease [Tissierellia bacterium]|nr:ABC transporter permease [Tissierellia bacterium]